MHILHNFVTYVLVAASHVLYSKSTMKNTDCEGPLSHLRYIPVSGSHSYFIPLGTFTGTIVCSLNWKNEKSCPDLGNCSRLGFDWSNSKTLWWTPMYWRITLLQNMGKVFVSSYILLTLFFFKEKPLFSFLEETNVYLHGLLKETVTLKKLWIMIYSKLQYKVIIGGWNDSARSKCKNVIKNHVKKVLLIFYFCFDSLILWNSCFSRKQIKL